MPAFRNHNATIGVPNTPGPKPVCQFSKIPAIFSERNFTISGVTKDETGAAAGGFTVYLMDMSSGVPVLSQTTVSDGSGNYSFIVNKTKLYWVIDYKTGSPDKAGATVNNLAGV